MSSMTEIHQSSLPHLQSLEGLRLRFDSDNEHSATEAGAPVSAEPDPFASPASPPNEKASTSSTPSSRPESYFGAASAATPAFGTKRHHKQFISRRLKETPPKPWLEEKDPHLWKINLLGGLIVLLGAAAAAYICCTGYASVPRHKYCLTFQDDFNNDLSQWQHEIQVGGFGNGEFEWTTDSANNSFIQNGMLHIVPTFTADVIGNDALLNGYTVNLTSSNTCTGVNATNCVAVSNSSTGAIINPVQSARLVTRNSTGGTIKYGRVEVRAKMPRGDWLWPAIWMMPKDFVYGEWPRSGEIDIAEAKGNDRDYPESGNNFVSSSLHWGPSTSLDRWYSTYNVKEDLHSTYSDEYHTFGLEWSEDYLFTYIDNRNKVVFSMNFDEPFYKRGQFPAAYSNGEAVVDPWSQTGKSSTPFDQEFYLIVNLAVGGSYFPDAVGGKPWVSTSTTSMRDFWDARDQWMPSWSNDPTQRSLIVDSVKMWQQC